MEELNGQLIMGEVAAMIDNHRRTEYAALVDKFKEAKTTDDCYTPPAIYDAIADYVAEEYGIKRERFLRPFRPGGDYQAEEYPEDCAVVDNPPFSILSRIVDWYIVHGVKFFLFGPTLTLLGLMKKPERKPHICIYLIGNTITYENGAEVQTSYVTNMDRYAIRIEADLRRTLEGINRRLVRENKKELPRYAYPDCLLTGKDYRLAKYGQTFRVLHEDCASVSELDAQRAVGKSVFGGGVLLSEAATAARMEAEAAADAQKAATEKAEGATTVWELSEREKALIISMRKEGKQHETGTGGGAGNTGEHVREAAGI